ncbi:Aste57867_19115 [Aphanomyces stellatus]|uniref:Aste57867_19115 protein n=1 Tax=Aphanomyces stellatus TaxID=120398 RepID=A0A485LBS9_9STRA|nr:hypothetical protein As57867_019051 [Aphanomyces stellatus]VFT95839.1 Aste57867_19115 [Aphanomyces stellatus]
MSLGFLTESALVPSKAKAIKVDSKSLVDLQAIIYKKEQERRKGAEEGRSETTSLRGKRGAHRAAKASEKSNPGIEKRKMRDAEDDSLGDDERAKKKRSRDILIEKAKLYDELARGDKVLQSSDGDALINFAEKQVVGHKDHEFVDGSKPVAAAAPLTMEVTDEFGRTKTVPFMAATASDEVLAASNTTNSSSSSYVVSQWERTLKQQEKGFLHQVHEETKQAKLTMADKTQRKQARLAKLKQALGTHTEDKDRSESAPSTDEVVVSAQAAREASAFLSNLL